MSQPDFMPKPVASCQTCGKPWYGSVAFCPFCGVSAKDTDTQAHVFEGEIRKAPAPLHSEQVQGSPESEAVASTGKVGLPGESRREHISPAGSAAIEGASLSWPRQTPPSHERVNLVSEASSASPEPEAVVPFEQNEPSERISGKPPSGLDSLVQPAIEPSPGVQADINQPAPSESKRNLRSEPPPIRSSTNSRWIAYLVVACLILGSLWWFFSGPSRTEQVAQPPKAPVPTSLGKDARGAAAPPPTASTKETNKSQNAAAKQLPSLPEKHEAAQPSLIPAPSAPSLVELFSRFPISEAQGYLWAMLDAMRNDNDSSVTAARRQLQVLRLPPHGDRKKARLENEEGLKFLQNDDPHTAINRLLVAANADPADQEILNNLGFALYRGGRLADARLAMIATLALAPERASAWSNLALILANEGKTEDAVAAFRLTYRFSQNPQKTRAYLEKLIQEDATLVVRETAARALNKILEASPPSNSVSAPVPVPAPLAVKNPAIAGMLEDGEDCMKKKKYDCAITNAKAALRLDKTNASARSLLHRAESEQKKAIDSISIN